MGKLEIGHVLSSVISFSAFVSRVWVLSHTLLVQLDTCYHCIYSLHLLATSADYTWLPEFLQLPPKFPVDVEKIVLQSSHREDDSQISMTSPAQEVADLMSTVEEDVGVVISRSSFKGVMDTVVDRSQPSGVLHRTQFQSSSGSTPDQSHAVGDSVLKKKKKKTKKLEESIHSLKVADIGKVVKRKKVKTKEDSFKKVNKVPMKVSKKGSKLGKLKKSRKNR
ncbi:hypothetical protein EB796_010221 [Bugula neritina]|uniref:Uncharacterized protein n=1 Tax=Bugula neritina TaxID=10212 RepID=A0A7J7JZV9_BUGNE|nr:hypothetical protein EB796_010221 [Bugula neritina]